MAKNSAPREELVRQARLLAEQGMTVEEIGIRINRRPSTVRNYLRKHRHSDTAHRQTRDAASSARWNDLTSDYFVPAAPSAVSNFQRRITDIEKSDLIDMLRNTTLPTADANLLLQHADAEIRQYAAEHPSVGSLELLTAAGSDTDELVRQTALTSIAERQNQLRTSENISIRELGHRLALGAVATVEHRLTYERSTDASAPFALLCNGIRERCRQIREIHTDAHDHDLLAADIQSLQDDIETVLEVLPFPPETFDEDDPLRTCSRELRQSEFDDLDKILGRLEPVSTYLAPRQDDSHEGD